MDDLYTGRELIKLIKNEYYICDNKKYNPDKWEQEIKKLYPQMKYANDKIGTKIHVMLHYIYCKTYYKSFNFEIFIKGMELSMDMLQRNSDLYEQKKG